MKTYQIGIIGYGGFGQFLHYWWSTMEGVKVTAVADHGLEEEDREGLKKYKNWQDLLKNEEIDIVSIAVPPALHAEVACAAMRADKHVLLEKPIALSNREAEQILEVQKETGKVVIVDHMLRYNPIIKALIQFSRNGVLGKIRHAVVSNYAQDESLPPGHWFWDKELSGGIFIEHAVHFFDIVNALTDQKFIKVYGCSHNRNENQQDQVAAMVLYNEGLIANHYHSFAGPGFFEQTTIRLVYDLAKIEIEGWIPMKGSISVLTNRESREKLHMVPGLEIKKVVSLTDLTDVSRPEGWGVSLMETQSGVRCSGIDYDVQEMVSATFKIGQTKSEVYGGCLKAILADLIAKIEDPATELRVTAEDAYESLKIAVLADRQL